MSEGTFSLALAFDTDDPEFCRGVEAGRLWEQLKTGEEVQQTIHATNAEMALRMCESLDETWIELHVDASNGRSSSLRTEPRGRDRAWGGRCWICGNTPPVLSLDHVIPRKDGGAADVENLRPACPGCNRKRDQRLKKLGGRNRRDAIALDVANTWHQAFPLPVFNDGGQLVELDPGLRSALSGHLRRVSYGRTKSKEAVRA